MVNIKFCQAANCKDFASTRDLCPKHYMQFRRYGDLMPHPVIKTKICLADGCITKKIVAKGLCWKHCRRELRSYYIRATYACLIFNSFPYWLLYLQDHPMPELNFDDLEKPKKVRRIPKPPHPNAKPCSIPGCAADCCQGKRQTKGFCLKHYTRFKRYGTTDLDRVDGRSAKEHH
jgi:hypothetical protein